jgi:hypothetical protein
MYRIRFPDGRLSDMVNLTRAKAAAVAFALQALNCEAQETLPDAPLRSPKAFSYGEYPADFKTSPRASYRIPCAGPRLACRETTASSSMTCPQMLGKFAPSYSVLSTADVALASDYPR